MDHLRLHGDLVARFTGDRSRTETRCRKALDLARTQGTRAYGLRAATHYARFLHEAGRIREAAAAVLPALDAFTEGDGTPDVRAARRLAAQLR